MKNKYDCCNDIGRYFDKHTFLNDTSYSIIDDFGCRRCIDYCPFCGQDQTELENNYEAEHESI
jgi:hypothetical protein